MILTILAIAIYLTGAYLDGKSSIPGKFYGLSEVNPLYSNKDKDYVFWRDCIVSGVFVGILIAIGNYDGGFAVALAAMFGGGRALASLFNRQRQKKNRAAQIGILETLRDGHVALLGPVAHRNGKAFFSLFRYLWVVDCAENASSDELYRVQRELEDKLIAQARKPESEWFV